MRRALPLQLQWLVPLAASFLASCTTAPTAPVTAPTGWGAPEVLVAPSSFSGVHGLAVDTQGRLLAGSVADKLPIGLSAGPGLPPPYVPTGVDVASDGTIYFSADRNNAVHRIRPAR